MAALPTRKRRRWFKPTVAIVTMLAAGAGLFAFQSGRSKAPEAKQETSKPLEFAAGDLVAPQRLSLAQSVPVSGTIRPFSSAMVKSKVAAEVAKVHVRDGEAVRRGQVLVTLDATDWKARYDAQAAVLADARARLTMAEKTQAANRELLARKFISQNAFDNAQGNHDVAAAGVNSATAQLAIQKRLLDETVVRAPIDGIVAKRLVQAGERVSEQQSLMSLVDLDTMELEAAVPAGMVGKVSVGTMLDFQVEGYGTRTFRGEVERINPQAEVGTRSIAVYVRIANRDKALKGGMFATGKVSVQAEPVLTLPAVAIREEAGSRYVFALAGDKVQRLPVETGMRNEEVGVVEIRSQLDPAARVISVKVDGLKHGAPARMTKREG
jgi:RND family efflux transporter MFP subunit